MLVSAKFRGSYQDTMIVVLVWLLLGASANASSMAAWLTSFGTSLVVHNTTTGIISSSLCNSSTLVFPIDPPNVLEVGITPNKETNLAATGYYDGRTSWASIFYLDEDLNIVNNLYACNNSTGSYRRQSTYIIQSAASSDKTGLAVILLDGDTLAYKLAYSVRLNHIHQAIGDSQGWRYTGMVSQDSDVAGNLLGATSSSSSSGTTFSIIVTPKGSQNIEVMDSDGSDDWHITTFPQSLTRHHSQDDPPDSFTFSKEGPSFTLPAWTRNPGALGVALDREYRYHVFYVGSDRRLHHIATGPPEIWALMPDRESAFWPLADEPDADFAIVSNPETSSMSIYYSSNGALVAARFEEGKWLVAAPVARVSFIKESNRRVNSGKMYALGLGIAFGSVVAIIIIIGAIFLMKRRARAKKQTLGRSHELISYDKHQPPASASGQGPGSRPQTVAGDGPMSAPESIADVQRRERGPHPSVFDDSDSDGVETVLSERWNKKPGGPGFEHVKPYDDFGTLNWRDSVRIERRSLSTAAVGESSKSACYLPQKSKTTGQLPDSKSTSDLPDASRDDSFELPIQNHDEHSS